MKIFICVFLLLAVSRIAHAETYFDDLKRYFKKSHESIAIADFDDIDSKKPKICVAVYAGNPEQEIQVYLRKFTIKKTGDGPLLPPKLIEKVLYSELGVPNVHGACQYVTTEFGRDEVHSTEIVDGSFNVYVRKYRHYLIFAVMGGTKDPGAYGYCY